MLSQVYRDHAVSGKVLGENPGKPLAGFAGFPRIGSKALTCVLCELQWGLFSLRASLDAGSDLKNGYAQLSAEEATMKGMLCLATVVFLGAAMAGGLFGEAARSAEDARIQAVIEQVERDCLTGPGYVYTIGHVKAKRLAERVPRDGRRRQLGDCLVQAIANRLRYEVFAIDTFF